MAQLRRMLGVLNDRPGELSPQPGLDDLPVLLDQVERSGVTVRLEQSGVTRALQADVQVAAYRIAQEALTNVLKHAREASRRIEARVALDWRDDELHLTIRDNGAGGPPGTGGHGLIGIGERAAACGGRAWCGPRDDGPGFRVVVRLPTNPHLTPENA
jgi:signal transduction histidine kinase